EISAAGPRTSVPGVHRCVDAVRGVLEVAADGDTVPGRTKGQAEDAGGLSGRDGRVRCGPRTAAVVRVEDPGCAPARAEPCVAAADHEAVAARREVVLAGRVRHTVRRQDAPRLAAVVGGSDLELATDRVADRQ